MTSPGAPAPVSIPDVVAPPPGNPRFPLLDSLRGLAALSILVFHVDGLNLNDTGRWVRVITWRLNIGVTVFFVLSGFLLYRPFVAARLEGRTQPRIRDYARRRVLRIVPAYWLALTVLAIYPGLVGVFTGDWWRYYGFAQNYSIPNEVHGIAQAWTLGIEASFYATLPLYALAITRATRGVPTRAAVRRDLIGLGALALGAVGARVVLGHNSIVVYTLPGMLYWFALGMAMAVASAYVALTDGHPAALRVIERWPSALWCAAVALMVSLTVVLRLPAPTARVSDAQALTGYVLFGLIAALFVLPAAFGQPRRGLPRRVLAWPALAWLGVVSYGVYLWHVQVFVWLRQHDATGWLPGGLFVRLLIGTIAVTLLFASASYYLVERPILRFKDRRLLSRGRSVLEMARDVVRRPGAAGYIPLGAALLAQAIVNWHFMSRSYFFVDDFKLLHDGLVGSLSLHYLASEPIAHFSPGDRLMTLLLEQHARFNYDAAAGFLLVVNSITVALVQRILALRAGPRWWTYVLAFAYGVSILLMPSLQWFSAGLLTITSAAWTLASIHAYLRWRVTARSRWLVWSVLAMGGGLFFYEKAVLIPLYLILLRLLVLEPSERVRDSALAVLREWRTWAMYAIPLALYVPAYLSRSYTKPWTGAPLHEVVTYLRVAWLDAFVPAVLGVRVTLWSSTALHTWAVAACQLGFVAIVALTVARRPAAWRAWLFFAIVFLINAVIVIPRLNPWGPFLVGYMYRYLTEATFLLVLTLGWVLTWPASDSSVRARLGAAAAGEAGRRRAPPAVRSAMVLIAAGALAAYIGLTWTGDRATIRSSPAAANRSWVRNLSTDVKALRQTGVEPVLLDGPVPQVVDPFSARAGDNFLSATVPDFLNDVHFDVSSDHTFAVARDGHLKPVSFRPAIGGSLAQLRSSGLLTARGDGASAFAHGGCLMTRLGWASLELRPPRPLLGRVWYLRSSYTTTPGTLLLVAVDRGVGYPPIWDRGLPSNPDGRVVLTNLGALPSGVPTFSRLSVDLPPGHRACVSSLVVGFYVPTVVR